jgi:Uma2 family endonuclease
MGMEVTKRRFDVDEYHRMAQAGILSEDDRVELIDGEIIEMSPIGNRHAASVDRATELFTSALRGRAQVSVQNPLRLDDYNEPQPDIIVLRRRSDYYASKSRTPEDAFLVVEVSDSTLRYDIDVKLPRYAAARVAEVWVENLEEDRLLVRRHPGGEGYATRLSLGRGDAVSALAFPDVVFRVGDLIA